MKTPTMNAILAPIREIEEKWREIHKHNMHGYEREKERAEIRLNAWREECKRLFKKGKPEPPRPDDPPDKPVLRRLMVNDASMEKLHVILSENAAGTLFFRDELTGVFDQLDDPGRGGDRQFLMDRWSAQRYTVDRISRGTIDADGCLSMLGGMTPRSLRLYVTDANKKGRLDDGLLQRFQLACYPDQLPWKHVDHLPNHNAIAQSQGDL